MVTTWFVGGDKGDVTGVDGDARGYGGESDDGDEQ